MAIYQEPRLGRQAGDLPADLPDEDIGAMIGDLVTAGQPQTAANNDRALRLRCIELVIGKLPPGDMNIDTVIRQAEELAAYIEKGPQHDHD